MPLADQYNPRSAGVRRLMKEAMELRKPTEMYHAQPVEDNLFEWHFTIRGTQGSDFDGGIYHGRMIFPADYPMKPPNVILLTPNGRFELNKKICLSISGYHPETWLPSWSIRTALLALIGFFPSKARGAIGSLEYTPAERKKLAKASADWECKECGCKMKTVLLPVTEDGQLKENEEAKTLAAQLNFQDESEVKKQVAEAEKAEKVGKQATDPVTTEAGESSEAPPTEEVPAEPAQPEAAPAAPEPAEPPAVEEDIEVMYQQYANRQNVSNSSFDYNLLMTIILVFFCLFVFITLLSRRFLIASPLSNGSEL